MFTKLKNQKTFFCNTAILHLFFSSYFKVGKIVIVHLHISIDFKLKNFDWKSLCIFASKELTINSNLSFKSSNFSIPFLVNFKIFRLKFTFDYTYFLRIIAFMKGNFLDKITQVLLQNIRFLTAIILRFHYFRTFHVMGLALKIPDILSRLAANLHLFQNYIFFYWHLHQ